MFLEKKTRKTATTKKQKQKKSSEKCPNTELSWSLFSSIRSDDGNLRSKSANSVRMQENMDQNNSVFGHFSRSVR